MNSETCKLSTRGHAIVTRRLSEVAQVFEAIGSTFISAEMAEDIKYLSWWLLLTFAFSAVATMGVLVVVGMFLRLAA